MYRRSLRLKMKRYRFIEIKNGDEETILHVLYKKNEQTLLKKMNHVKLKEGW